MIPTVQRRDNMNIKKNNDCDGLKYVAVFPIDQTLNRVLFQAVMFQTTENIGSTIDSHHSW